MKGKEIGMELKNNIFENITDTPKEHYTFHFETIDLLHVEKKYMGILKKRLSLSVIMAMILLVICIFHSAFFAGFGAGVLFMTIVFGIGSVQMTKKQYLNSYERCITALFDYSLYDEFLIVWISSENAIRQMKVRLNEIKNIREIGDLLTFEIDGRIYLMRKAELIENSYFIKMLKMSLEKNKSGRKRRAE
ncbi:MAG: hypothetical protein E7617_02450 [Ruminococcaceae bacterium]|nr:hypothetical protein [Oscillospiraceae bacterium]